MVRRTGQCGPHGTPEQDGAPGGEGPELVGPRKEFRFYAKCFLARVIVYFVARLELRPENLAAQGGLLASWFVPADKLLAFSVPQFPHLSNGGSHRRVVVGFEHVKLQRTRAGLGASKLFC